ncbi:hypothetical protein EIN_173920 [Entamoeba invadens IP1]|uniref:Rho-GAP domain-containing protein n=1 Tax=Entamoeba invadens IP1 TaxID=370355 RepID=A0A0A1TW29_ENTIV|nr:hypothetical protein EIN_173920 [Entamoeba invadens IP1]ELP84717.1 hypothetical protein EIN_173920 [Entamoeba invadens IP1]|eukprot:XP_004184063.1 hypothetical protein EIN_173920 [Entamoeba invadens IP1]
MAEIPNAQSQLKYNTVSVYKNRKFTERSISIFKNSRGRYVLAVGSTEFDMKLSVVTRRLDEDRIEDDIAALCFRVISDRVFIVKCSNLESLNFWLCSMFNKTEIQGFYGIPLRVAISKSQWRFPLPLYRSLQYLENHKGDELVGVFRLSAGAQEMKEIRSKFDLGKDYDPEGFTDCVLASCVVKDYLRALPEPLIPFDLYQDFIAIPTRKDGKAFVEKLPLENHNTLWYFFSFLRRVIEKEKINKMNSFNIATCITLGICKKPNNIAISDLEHLDKSQSAVVFLLDNFDEAFGDIEKLNLIEGMSVPSYPIQMGIEVAKTSKVIEKMKEEKKSYRKSLKSGQFSKSPAIPIFTTESAQDDSSSDRQSLACMPQSLLSPRTTTSARELWPRRSLDRKGVDINESESETASTAAKDDTKSSKNGSDKRSLDENKKRMKISVSITKSSPSLVTLKRTEKTTDLTCEELKMIIKQKDRDIDELLVRVRALECKIEQLRNDKTDRSERSDRSDKSISESIE